MQNSGASNGPFGGCTVTAPDGSSVRPETTCTRPVTAVSSDSVAAKPGIGEGSNAAMDQKSQAQGSSGKTAKPAARRPEPPSARDDAALDKAGHDPAQRILAKPEAGPTRKGLKSQVRFVKVGDGLRIDMVERVDFSMFSQSTSAPTSQAGELMQITAYAIEDMPNALTVRGHTDALGFSGSDGESNWSLSTARADETRRLLMGA